MNSSLSRVDTIELFAFAAINRHKVRQVVESGQAEFKKGELDGKK